MENVNYSDELQHHGIMGMKWGQRRYQNKDGSLTVAGQKRYNKEVEKLKKETAKVKAAEQLAANRKKTQAKLDKLDAKKQDLEERKKALKAEKFGKKKRGESDENIDETPEQRKERLLKSTDPKELYKYKDELTTFELNERINRIDTENRLQSKIVEEHKTTGLEYMDKARNTIDKTTNLFKSVDGAYSAVSNSAIGKTLMKQLGIEPPKKVFDPDSDVSKMDLKDILDFNKGVVAYKNILEKQKDIKNMRNAEKEAKEAAEKAAKAEKEAAEKAAKADRDAKESSKKAAREAEENARKAAREAAEKLRAAQKEVDEYNAYLRGEGESQYRYNKKNDGANVDIIDSAKKTVSQLLLSGPTKNEDGTPRIGAQKISGLLENNEYASNKRAKGETIIDVEPDEIIYLKDRQNTGKQIADKYISSSKKQDVFDVEYIKREKDGDGWKYTYDDDSN